jgi:hypothetical protein
VVYICGRLSCASVAHYLACLAVWLSCPFRNTLHQDLMELKEDIPELEPHELAIAGTELAATEAALQREWEQLCEGLDREGGTCNPTCKDILRSLLNPDPTRRQTAQQVAQDIFATDIGCAMSRVVCCSSIDSMTMMTTTTTMMMMMLLLLMLLLMLMMGCPTTGWQCIQHMPASSLLGGADMTAGQPAPTPPAACSAPVLRVPTGVGGDNRIFMIRID